MQTHGTSGTTMSNIFLTTDNLEQLKVLLQRYFKERRQISIPDFWASSQANEMLKRAMMQVITEVRGNQLSNERDVMNKRTMAIMIQNVLQYLEQKGASSSQKGSPQAQNPRVYNQVVERVLDEEENTLQNQQEEITSENGMSLHEQYGVLTPEETSVDKDRMFMVKLQELELARTNMQIEKQETPISGITTIPSINASNSPNGPIKSVFDVLLPQVQQASIPTSISTVFMPTPPRKGQEFLINSWQRNWVQYPQRNNYQWTLPIPSGMELSMTRVAGMFLPKQLLRKSPYVVLQVEGAGTNTCQAILIPDKASTFDESPWALYRPLNDDLGYLKTISIPWQVRLYTANGILLNLGRDGGDFTILEPGLAELGKEYLNDLQVGDQVWMFGTEGDICWCEVTHINRDTQPYTFSYDVEDSTKIKGNRGNILNFSRQWSIILDLHRSQVQK